MDDTREEKAPKARAGTGRTSSRRSATDAPATKVKESKPRSGSTGLARADTARPARKAPAKPKAPAGTEAAAKPEAAPKAKTSKAKTAKVRPASKPRGKAPAKQASAPAVPAFAKAPEPELAPVARAGSPFAQSQGDGPAADVAIHPVAPHAPNVQPHDDGLEFGLSPVDLAPDASLREEAGFAWFVRILALSSVLLVLFNSFAIDKWAREQPVTKLNSQVLIAAHQLHDGMKSFHLDTPLEGMRSIWHGIKAAQWPGSESGPERPEQDRGAAS